MLRGRLGISAVLVALVFSASLVIPWFNFRVYNLASRAEMFRAGGQSHFKKLQSQSSFEVVSPVAAEISISIDSDPAPVSGSRGVEYRGHMAPAGRSRAPPV